MAQYKVTHTCNHQVTHNLLGKDEDRQKKIEWYKTTLCKDCYLEKKQEEAKELNKNSNLIELSGTDKQISWALSIRDKSIKKLEQEINDLVDKHPEQVKDLFIKFTNIVLKKVKNQNSAQFWIENRENLNLKIFVLKHRDDEINEAYEAYKASLK